MACEGGGVDEPKRMAYGQLRFWAAGKLAYESDAWPQVLVFVVVATLFSENNGNSIC